MNRQTKTEPVETQERNELMIRREKSHKLLRDNQSLDMPTEFNLEQNSPNPFTGQTGISFSVPRPGDVKIMVYNPREELQCILHDGHLEPGSYRLTWDGSDAAGRPLKPGSYVYCLQAAGFIATRRLAIKKWQT